LPHRQAREDVIGEMRCRRDHAPGVARRAHAAPLAGESDQEVVAALPTTGAGETVGEDAALQVAAEFALDVGRHWVAVSEPIAPEREPRREVGLHGAIEQGALGPPPAVRRRPVRYRLLHHRHAAPKRPVHRDGRSW